MSDQEKLDRLNATLDLVQKRGQVIDGCTGIRVEQSSIGYTVHWRYANQDRKGPYKINGLRPLRQCPTASQVFDIVEDASGAEV